MRFVTHRCDSAHSHDEGSGSEQSPCEAVRYNDGTMDRTCGEPCSWVMGKGGHGNPPWQTGPDGTRFDPSIPDAAITITRLDTEEARESAAERLIGMTREEAFRCAWNEKTNAVDLKDGCKNPGSVYLGAREEYFLCDQCAALPRFKRHAARRPARPRS